MSASLLSQHRGNLERSLSLLILWTLLVSISMEEQILPVIETNNQYQKYYRDLVTAKNSRFIDEFNKDSAHPFRVKRNQFISMSNDEFHSIYTMKVKYQQSPTIQVPALKLKNQSNQSNMKGSSLSSIKITYETAGCDSINVDWTIHATPVKDQGQCNSCYAHSTIASIQAKLHVDFGIKYDLSQQQVTECSANWVPTGYEKLNNKGCDGGWGWKALAYAQLNGVALEESDPYTAGKDKILKPCNQSEIKGKRFKVGGFEEHYESNQPETQCHILNEKLIEGNAIAVSIWVPQGYEFQFYGSETPDIDIFHLCGNYTAVNHELLLVGSTDRYWKLKNSFGVSWGQKGYLYLDKSKSLNCLNICMDFSFPTGNIAEINGY